MAVSRSNLRIPGAPHRGWLVVILAVVLATLALAPPVGARVNRERAQTVATCGVERLAVKTLTDRAAGSVNFTAQPTTVVQAQMARARMLFVTRCGQPSSSHFLPVSGTAIIVGVGFFDRIHGQAGVAPNGIELHPVLSFKSLNCR